MPAFHSGVFTQQSSMEQAHGVSPSKGSNTQGSLEEPRPPEVLFCLGCCPGDFREQPGSGWTRCSAGAGPRPHCGQPARPGRSAMPRPEAALTEAGSPVALPQESQAQRHLGPKSPITKKCRQSSGQPAASHTPAPLLLAALTTWAWESGWQWAVAFATIAGMAGAPSQMASPQTPAHHAPSPAHSRYRAWGQALNILLSTGAAWAGALASSS